MPASAVSSKREGIVPYLVFIELVLVKAICFYCTIMHIAIIADFIIISCLLLYRKDAYLTKTADQPSGYMAADSAPARVS
jgi:hypothetical protein